MAFGRHTNAETVPGERVISTSARSTNAWGDPVNWCSCRMHLTNVACPLHLEYDGWGHQNKIYCDFFHRGVTLPREKAVQDNWFEELCLAAMRNG